MQVKLTSIYSNFLHPRMSLEGKTSVESTEIDIDLAETDGRVQ